jgi:hypothetical protein
MSLKTCLISLLLIAVAFVANAVTYYKSVDEKGNVQYTQTRPNNTRAESIKVDAYSPTNSSTYKRPSLKTDRSADKTKEPEPAEKKMSRKQQREACASARTTLATLNATGQIRQRNAKGEVRYLTDIEKQARIKKTLDLVNKHCK